MTSESTNNQDGVRVAEPVAKEPDQVQGSAPGVGDQKIPGIVGREPGPLSLRKQAAPTSPHQPSSAGSALGERPGK